MAKEMVKKPVKALVQTGGNSPAEMIRMAVTGGADLDKLEKLLTLQERWEANEAKKAYQQAMAKFKANPPKIEKDKKVGYTTQKGTVGYSHASLANVTEKISKELSKYGLSASWLPKQNGSVFITCKITHEKGHSEEATLSAPADTSGSKNSIQAIGSTITYLERYTLLALTGLATHDMDDDSAAGGTEYISDKQLSEITDMVDNIPIDKDKFLKYLEVEELAKIPLSMHMKAMAALKASQKRKEAKK